MSDKSAAAIRHGTVKFKWTGAGRYTDQPYEGTLYTHWLAIQTEDGEEYLPRRALQKVVFVDGE